MLLPGANAPLSSMQFSVDLTYPSIAGTEIDASAFLIGTNGKVRSDADMCFYHQPHAGDGAIHHINATPTGSTFRIDLAKIPHDVEKVVFTATIYENQAAFKSIDAIVLQADTVELRIPCAGKDETALILAEIYKRNGDWKIRNIGQGFLGGLAALATHLGVSIDDAPAPAPEITPAPIPVSLTKIKLTKSGETSKISLQKNTRGVVKVTATWIDNGDSRSDNDDLDLRAGILLPNGDMHWLAASHPGSLDSAPYARHLGDIQGATANAPGTEVIEFDSAISRKLGGPVGLVFSIYSAVSNGDVSIASLKPVMTVEYNGHTITCEYSFPDGKAAKSVYTYVIATVFVDNEDLDVQLSGLTSPRSSENTPWIERRGNQLDVAFKGAPVFKKGNTMMARMMGAGLKKYANL